MVYRATIDFVSKGRVESVVYEKSIWNVFEPNSLVRCQVVKCLHAEAQMQCKLYRTMFNNESLGFSEVCD
jgi:hypothetical protein